MRKKSAVCSCSGCGRPVKTKGLCQTHYWRWKKSGDDFDQSPPRPKRKWRICSIPRCTEPHHAKGFCQIHYANSDYSAKNSSSMALAIAADLTALFNRVQVLRIAGADNLPQSWLSTLDRILSSGLDDITVDNLRKLV